MPVKAVEGACLVSEAFFDLVMTVAAVITHFVDIATASGIGLGGDKSTVRELAHASRIRHFYPFDSVYINTQIPIINLSGVNTSEHCKVTRYH